MRSPPIDAASERRLLIDDWLGTVRELPNYATQVALGLSSGQGETPSGLSLA